MINLLAPPPIPPKYVFDYEETESKERNLHYSNLLFGKTKDEVIQILGKPKPRNVFYNRRCFCDTCKVSGKNEYRNAEETFWYSVYFKGKYSRSYCSLEVYFEAGRVICVRSA